MEGRKDLKRKAPDSSAPATTTTTSAPPPSFHLDTSKQATKKWLVRIPAFLYEEWEKAETDMEVGVLKVNTKGESNEITMELNNNTDDGLPLQYVLQNMPIKGSMAVFSENVCTGSVELDGGVDRFVDMKAADEALLKEYIAKKTLSVKQSLQNASNTEVTETVDTTTARTLTVRNRLTGVEKEEDQHGYKVKNFRVQKEEVVERILNAFRLKDEFTFKDLNEIVKQPEAYLKEILPEFCVQEKKDNTAAKWVLRKEFRSSKQQKTEVDQSPAGAAKVKQEKQ